MQERRRLLILPAFFASGASALVYQVIWVREFGQVFGNTVQSAALVTAAFMCGLGFGSYFAGAYCDKRPLRRALAAYAIAELAIATLGLLAAFVLPRLAGMSAGVSSYAIGDDGFSHLSFGSYALRYVFAVVLLGPPTAIMGATLTLLVRWFVGSEVVSAGRRVGLLYGLNTAGAAIGCFLTDALLVPHLGLFRTQFVAVAGNVAAGVVALALLRGEPPGEPIEPVSEPEPSAEPKERDQARDALTLALAASGFAGMALEIVWFRHASAAFGHSRAVFSILLTVMLVGLWLGSALGGRVSRKNALTRYASAAFLVAAVSLALLARFDRNWPAIIYDALHFTTDAGGERPSTLGINVALLAATVALVGPPSILLGVSFPIANAAAQDEAARVGRRTGVLYLANTFGALVGSIAAGFALMPAVGVQATAWFAALAAALAGGLALWSARARAHEDNKAPPLPRSALACGGVAAIAVAAWWALPLQHLVRSTLSLEPGERIFATTEGVDQAVALAEDGAGNRRLYTDGHSMSATTPAAQRYMRTFAHVPLLQLDSPRAALLICFGVGNTAHALSLHPSLERVDVADLSETVLEHAHDFAATNGDVLRDPRFSVFVNDGRQHLRMVPPGTYDLVTLEPPPLGMAGTGALYSREFYELAKTRLKEGGFVSQWLPIYEVTERTALAVVRAFVDVFPASALLVGDGGDLVLVGRNAASFTLDVDAVERRLVDRPAVAADLARIGLRSPTELGGAFLAAGDDLIAATRGVEPTTDDRPLLEYDAITWLDATHMPMSLVRVDGLARFCPSCAAGDRAKPLEAYLTVTRAAYAAAEFHVSPEARPARIESPRLFAEDPDAGVTIATYSYLDRSFSSLFTGALFQPSQDGARLEALRASAREHPKDAPLLAQIAALELAAGDGDGALRDLDAALAIAPDLAPAHFARGYALLTLKRPGAVKEYRRGIASAPANLHARMTLAQLLAGEGKRDEAVAELSAVLAMDPNHVEANLTICMLLRDRPACQRAARLGALPTAGPAH